MFIRPPLRTGHAKSSFSSSEQIYKMGVIIAILQMKKLRLRGFGDGSLMNGFRLNTRGKAECRLSQVV